jgi:hypothetical protein
MWFSPHRSWTSAHDAHAMKRRTRPIGDVPFDKALSQARALAALLAPFALKLSTKDRNRRLKMPRASADAIPHLLDLAKTQGLGAYAAPIEEHRSALAKLAELRLFIGHIETIMSDLAMTSESKTWAAATTVYTMLRRLARSDGDLAALLQPVVKKYFARNKRGAEKTPAVAAEAGPP